MSQATQRVGQYNFLKKLGAGRMAEVYLGRIEGAEGFQKPVAIKKILPELATDLQFVQSLIAEAKVGGQLHHRNIVEVYDFIRYGNDYCIIMEYVDGVDLGRILRSARRYRVRIPPAAALYIASQVCDGLDYAHSARGFNGEPLSIVHRDLKPSNILISIKGGVKISDFGIARVMEQVIARTGAAARSSFQYQSPEQLTGGMRLTSASDIFAIGVILFEMLTLEPLFQGKTVLEALEGLREAELPRRLSLAQRQLPGAEKILAMALNPNPAERYRSAAMMSEDLKRLLVYMKVDDPRERLVTFFQRLVRFVQEQGKKPADGQAADQEEWDVDTRVANQEDVSVSRQPSLAQTIAEPVAPAPTWVGAADSGTLGMGSEGGMGGTEMPMPPHVPGNDTWAGQHDSGMARGGLSGYGGVADTTGGLAWNGREGETIAGSYATVGAVDEATPIRPLREETQVGAYDAVDRGYGSTANIAMTQVPPSTMDSTRILSAAEAVPTPPPAYPPQTSYPPPSPESWAGAGGDAGTQILSNPPSFPESDELPDVRPRSRARLFAMGAAVVLVLMLGGAGVAYFKNSGVEPAAPAAQTVQCSTCGQAIPATAPFCPFCGAKIGDAPAADADVVRCPDGHPNEKGAKFCETCGKPL